MDIDISPQFTQVLNFINSTNQPVFLTGKAGTGKTTLLRHIRQNTFKQLAVVAPTGVAAINAGGATIHAFFQFAFAPFIPVTDNSGSASARHPMPKYNAQRLAIIRNLELLVIDEVSMVRADLLDQIDHTLRVVRKKWMPFGGVQVLLIGDMHQLPPVVQPEEWKLLNGFYKSPYFFESLVVKNNPMVYIELDKVYRQKDATFVALLNKIRNNILDKECLDLLNQRYRPQLTRHDYQDNITLTTHNHKAHEINRVNLEALPGKEFTFKATVNDTFPEKSYPADATLTLKVGTRVMFLRNNTEKNYYNGKTGVITTIADDKIRVQCPADDSEIEVVRETWSNVGYKLNKSDHHVEEEVLGTFIQFPLRLAWAITIHKSQGLTFDRVIIDAAASFSAGQVYVALSRCRSLEGVTLSSPVSQGSLHHDAQVAGFSATRHTPTQVQSLYTVGQRVYMRTVLEETFGFSPMLRLVNEVRASIQAHTRRINPEGLAWATVCGDMVAQLCDVSSKFRPQLVTMIENATVIENDVVLQERICRAAAYFTPGMAALSDHLAKCTLYTESKEAATELNESLQALADQCFAARYYLEGLSGGFVWNEFVKRKLALVYPDQKINVYASAKSTKVPVDIEHPQLYRQLLELRDDLCAQKQKPVYLVASNKTILELAFLLPLTTDALEQIHGFGPAKVKLHGEDFLNVIRSYAGNYNLSSNMHLVTPAKKKKSKKAGGVEPWENKSVKTPTREQTYRLYQAGFAPGEIARERGLSLTTVETHLLPYVSSGEININALVPAHKQELIKTLLAKQKREETKLGTLKGLLPDEVSYADIKFVLAAEQKN